MLCEMGLRAANVCHARGVTSDEVLEWAVKARQVRFIQAPRGGLWIEFGPKDRVYVIKSRAMLLAKECRARGLHINEVVEVRFVEAAS